MNVMAPAQSSFEEARRRHLIEATVEAVADVGFKAASLSQIARRANVSTGLYAHYFRDKDGLLEATLRFLAARLAAALRQRLRTATTPRERLLAVVDAALGDQEFDRRTSAVWLAFWGQIAHSDRFQRIQYAYQRRLHTNLRHAFRACVPADRAEPCATIVAGLIDGLWLQSHAYRGGASADQARATVHDVVVMLIESSARAGADRSPIAPARRAVVMSRDRASAPDSKLVERARRAATLWTAKSPRDRAAVLLRCAQLVAAHGPSLARLDAAASGRPVLTGIEFFIPRCVAAFEAAAERARGPASIRHDLGDGVTGTEIAVCAGVACAEAYRSAPLLDLCRAVADALSGGRSLVVDIPRAARAVAAEVEGLLVQAGVPRGSVGLCVRDGDEAEDAGAPQNAAIILKGADIERAIETVLAARGPGRRTPDARDVVVFVDKSVLRAAETAANGWSREAGRTSGADGTTVVPLRDLEAGQPADRDASTLRLVGFDTDDALLAMLERVGFGTVAIFADDDRRADRIARAVPAPYCSINAYGLGHTEAADRFRAWVPSGLRPAVTRRLLTFADAPA